MNHPPQFEKENIMNFAGLSKYVNDVHEQDYFVGKRSSTGNEYY